MVEKQMKIDVTDRITGKLKKGIMELYYENTLIGKIKFPGDIVLDPHFETHQRKIYHHISIPDSGKFQEENGLPDTLT